MARKWEEMTEDERHEFIMARIRSGTLEIAYARPGPSGMYYLTLKPPPVVVPTDDYNGTHAYPDEN